MKKVIDGKTYNTETACKLGARDNGYRNHRDFNYCCETLYQTKKGNYFIFGEGGAESKYKKQLSYNEWGAGEHIVPISIEEAKSWVKKHLNAEEYAKIFDEPEEA